MYNKDHPLLQNFVLSNSSITNSRISMDNGSSSHNISAAPSLNSIPPNSFTSTRKTEMEKRLLIELIGDRELLTDLKARLDKPSAIEICKSLVSNRLLSIEKALAIEAGRKPANRDSSMSPRSENLAQPFKNPQRKEPPKKRKTSLPIWTNQVSLGSGVQFDGPPVDGYNWRKYGNKDIRDAIHQRAYYRCTHLYTRGCPAKKHVQRSNDNPSIFNVTYSGTHTCGQTSLPTSPLVRGPNRAQPGLEPDQLLLCFQADLNVKTCRTARSDSFSFASTPVNGSNHAHYAFCFPSTPVNGSKLAHYAFSSQPVANYCFTPDVSPQFISPATSESIYFSMGCNLDFAAQETDFGEIISGSNSDTNSPIADIDFLIDSLELDACFDDPMAPFTQNF